MRKVRSFVALLTVLVLVAAACGDDDDSTSSASTTAGGETTTTAAELTDSFRGVTADSIKIAIATVDFKCLTDPGFIDFNQGDTQKIANALIDDINSNGGILGRTIEPVYYNLCPLQPDAVVAACTSMTDDDQVFAVLGTYDTPPSDGSNQLCVTADHDTILINELVPKAIMDQAPPGLLLQPGILTERRLAALFALLAEEGTLDGKTVALLADQNTQGGAEPVVESAAADIGFEQGSTGVLTITSDDTSAAQAQLDSFIEAWKGEGVDTIVMAGLLVSATQFVDKIRAAMPDVLLLTDDSSTGEQAQDEKYAGGPNPYEGMLTLSGLSDQETFETPNVQACVKTYEDATGETVVAPDDLQPGPDGVKSQVYVGIQDRCNELSVLTQVAEKAGANLTNDTWIAAVNDFGAIELTTTTIASFEDGKYDADNGFRLAEWNSSLGPDGEFEPITDLLDVTA
jgi:hypothetical protein